MRTGRVGYFWFIGFDCVVLFEYVTEKAGRANLWRY